MTGCQGRSRRWDRLRHIHRLRRENFVADSATMSTEAVSTVRPDDLLSGNMPWESGPDYMAKKQIGPVKILTIVPMGPNLSKAALSSTPGAGWAMPMRSFALSCHGICPEVDGTIFSDNPMGVALGVTLRAPGSHRNVIRACPWYSWMRKLSRDAPLTLVAPLTNPAAAWPEKILVPI